MFNITKLFRKKRKVYKSLGEKCRTIPVEPWAFMRVKNEIRTIQVCLDSIIPAIKKGVIGYHRLADGEHDDGTIEVIENFCKVHSGFIPFFYNYEVIPSHDQRYRNLENVAMENRLDTYYTKVLDCIPEEAWFIKIDGDHVYDADKLLKLFYLPEDDNEVITISRVNLHYMDGKIYYIKNDEYRDSGDHWLLTNKELYFTMDVASAEDDSWYAYEMLRMKNISKRTFVHTDLCNWHFPYMKAHRPVAIDQLRDFNDVGVTSELLRKWHTVPDMLDEERIIHVCEKFNI